MNIASLIVTLALLPLPAIFTLFYPARADAPVDHARVRRLRLRLWISTGAALTLFAVLALLRNSPWLAWWGELPRIVTLGAAMYQLAWLAFFPLWFCLAMPLFVACRPEAATPYPRGMRAATLTRRDIKPIVPKAAWLVLCAVWLATAIACAMHWPEARRAAFSVTFLLGSALAALPLGAMAARRSLQEAEPLDPSGSRELRDAYAALRRARAWGFYALEASMLLTFGALAFMTALGLQRAGAYGGGIAGSLIGIGGAAFGVITSNRRMRIKRRLDQLCGDATPQG